MNKNESKYFNTAIKMDEALLKLLEKKEFSYITIKEICETAGVNRSTFYLHYENTADVLQETTRYIIDRHLTYYSTDSKKIVLRFESCEKQELIFITEEYLIPYLTFIKENQRVFKIALKQFNTMNFNEVYGKMFKHIFSPILARFEVPAQNRRYIMKFYLSGIFAVVMEWLADDCSKDIKEVIQIITDCVLGERNIHE